MITLSTFLRFLPLLTTLALALSLVGCDSDDTCAPCADGRIVGSIISTDGPVAEGRIRVESVGPIADYRLRVDAATDTSGQFVLALPAGRYVLSARPPHGAQSIWFSRLGPTCISAKADTLEVTRGASVTADFVLGGLDIVMEIPPGLEGAAITCAAHGISEGDLAAMETGFAVLPALSFSFPAVPPGAYNIHVEVYPSGAYYSRSLMWLKHSLVVEEADTYAVRALETTLWEGTLPVPGYLQGAIQGCWVEADFRTPKVYVYDLEKRIIAQQRVDDQGGFAVPLYAPGDVRLWYWHEDHSGWVGGGSFEEAEQFHIGSGISIDVDPIVLGCLIGHATEPPSGEAPSAYLRLHGEEAGGYYDTKPLRDEFDFGFSGLEPGSYYLSISPFTGETWRPQWYDRAGDRESATPIVITEVGEIVEIEVTLELGGVIRGRVFDTDGTGAGDMTVLVNSMNSEWNVPSGWSTAFDGSLEVTGLADGDFILGVRYYVGEERMSSYYPGVSDPDSAEVITIIDAGEVTGIEWQIQ